MDATVSLHDPLVKFGKDVDQGLSAEKKYLDSKYFYDDNGSRLFQQIMKLPEYYLTDCELEILVDNKELIVNSLGIPPQGFELLEFGAGDGMKTAILLEYLLHRNSTRFQYIPIDISSDSNDRLERKMKKKFPQLRISPINNDYLTTLHELDPNSQMLVILLLGGNIGNYRRDEALSFYQDIYGLLRPGDKILTGFDLVKDPGVILQAYDDPAGVTRAFNLNLLHRINRELGGNFDTRKFMHCPVYNPATGAAKSYLVSTVEQEVILRSTGTTYRFEKWEPVFMEISQKYTPGMIEELATGSGFRVTGHYTDSREYFACSLWERV